jgi:hypothetical protein
MRDLDRRRARAPADTVAHLRRLIEDARNDPSMASRYWPSTLSIGDMP